MLENVAPVNDLAAHARRASKKDDTKSVRRALVAEEVAQGWVIKKQRKTTVSLTRPKNVERLFEDRVWTVLYRMGFTYMSGKGGATLRIGSSGDGAPNQLDVVALDDEIAIYVECKTTAVRRRSSNLQAEFARLDSFRRPLSQAIAAQVSKKKRRLAALFWSMNLEITENDTQRATSFNIRLFDEPELTYYEDLVKQIGEAARFQFLADVFAGSEIPGLEMVVPAVRSAMGGRTCYTFPIAPRDLLKIAYVSHRAKGSPADVDTYQRLINAPAPNSGPALSVIF